MDARLKRLYERLGVRYAYLLFIAAGTAIPVMSSLVAGFIIPYADASWSEYEDIVWFVFPSMSLVAGIAWGVIAPLRTRPLLRWMAGSRTPGRASQAWRIAVTELPMTGLILTLILFLGAIPSTVYGAHAVAIDDPGGVIAALGAISVLLVTAASLYLLLFERLLRPVIAEIAEDLPSDFTPQRSPLSIGGKLILLVPIISAATGIIAAGLSTDSLGPDGKLAVGVGSAAAITLTFSLGATLLIRDSLTSPMGFLLRAMDRVRQGDLDADVAPMSADEVSVVTTHFNSMLAGLREREALRGANLELVDELRASRARIVATADEERRRMERDLHDGAQQNLVMINLKLGLLKRQIEADPAAASAAVDDLHADLQLALAELRDLAHGIYPAVLENEGLPAALGEAAERAAIPTSFSADSAERYPPELEAAVYFCCLEALQNASKYAGEGATATVALEHRDGELRFEVKDDGKGFDPASANNSAGLQNMVDRIGALGGELRVESQPGVGTVVEARVPVR